MKEQYKWNYDIKWFKKYKKILIINKIYSIINLGG